MRLILVGMLAFLAFPWARGQDMQVRVAMAAPERHFLQVELELRGFPGDELAVVFPVWTPGSYRVRDYSQFVEGFRAATGEGVALDWAKTDKDRFRVQHRGSSRVRLSFEVFAYEASVRHSYLDDRQAFLTPASCIPFVEGHLDLPCTLEVIPPPGWVVDTALPLRDGKYHARDYDHLVDCPLQLGTQVQHDFLVEDVAFRLSVTGEGNLNVPAMAADMQKVIAAAGEIFGGFPFSRYVFLLRLGAGGGGLEHADSCALMTSGYGFDGESGWNRFLGLVAHEFFHAWNVKRIHDAALGPFDYRRENYTRLLWVHEGWTSYYGQVLLLRAGFLKPADYRKNLANSINRHLARPGRSVQSLVESSFDAWIKYYQTSETTANSTVDYYGSGALTGYCLDWIIRDHSDNQKSLDDVMRALDQRFGATSTGFTLEDLRTILSHHGGPGAVEFMDRHVLGTETIPFDQYLQLAALRLQEKPAPKPSGKPYERPKAADFGFSTSSTGGRLSVRSVDRGGVAWEAGLDFGDELLAVDDRVIQPSNWEHLVQEAMAAGADRLDLLVARRGRIIRRDLPLGGRKVEYEIVRHEEASERAKAIHLDHFGEAFPEPPPEEAPDAPADAPAEVPAGAEESAADAGTGDSSS